MQSKSHILVIGGSGMLRGLCLSLAKDGHCVSVIARNRSRLESIQKDAVSYTGEINPIALNYRDIHQLGAAVEASISGKGHIQMVISWVRSDATDVLPTIIRIISVHQKPWRLFEIKGGSSVKPGRNSPSPDISSVADICRYSRIILGFIQTSSGSRWLTDQEICDGVMEAISCDIGMTVGTIEPWEAHP